MATPSLTLTHDIQYIIIIVGRCLEGKDKQVDTCTHMRCDKDFMNSVLFFSEKKRAVDSNHYQEFAIILIKKVHPHPSLKMLMGVCVANYSRVKKMCIF